MPKVPTPPEPLLAGELPAIETMQQAVARAEHAEKKADSSAPKVPPTPTSAPTPSQTTLTKEIESTSKPPLSTPEAAAVIPPTPAPEAKVTAPSPQPKAPIAQTPAPAKPAGAPKPALNLEKIVLPRKNEPSLLSAERSNAANVLTAEQTPLPRTAPALPQTIAEKAEYAKDIAPALHTYQSDVEDATRHQEITLASIAEAQSRAAREHPETMAEPGTPRVARFLEILIGVLFACFALALIGFVLFRGQGGTILPAPTSAALIAVDDTKKITLPWGESGSAALSDLAARAQHETLSLGLLERFDLFAAASATSSAVELTAPQFLALTLPDAPQTLSRAIAPQFLFGIHSFGGNQSFIIFITDPSSYDQAFAAMLAWESSMASDLRPLLPLATSTASSSAALSTTFTDATIANHDARVVKDASGNVILLWSFINRSTLIIATNEHTLSEVISRLTQAPTVPSLGR